MGSEQRPLYPGIIRQAERIARLAWDRANFRPVDDFDNQPLYDGKREIIRDRYQLLIKSLPRLGFSPDQLSFGTSYPEDRDFNFPRLVGNYRIGIRDYRDERDPGKQVKKVISIDRTVEDDIGRGKREFCEISNNGVVDYTLIEETLSTRGSVGVFNEEDSQWAFKNSQTLTQGILNSIKNPESLQPPKGPAIWQWIRTRVHHMERSSDLSDLYD